MNISRRTTLRSRSSAFRAGFTLIEVLIVIAISAMLSAMVIIYGSVGRNTITLSEETAKISHFLFQAKELAASGYAPSTSVCGYGVFFDYANNEYSLFAYEPGGLQCPDAASISISSFNDSEMSPYSDSTWKVPVKPGVHFQQGSGDAVVLFYPPDPTTLISTNDGTFWSDNQPSSSIKFVTADGQTTSTITVNSVGQITTN